jgi:tRNA-specific 2-thiouridylase
MTAMNIARPPRTIVALSGGVDSAVAALLLLRAGHRVEALHMTNWDDDDGYCNAARDFQDARSICRELEIPLHRVNFAREYREQVFTGFLREYRRGRTPNPDVLCNREIKFGAFLQYARRLGGELIATGHYARLSRDVPSGLLRGTDATKDQSYFLHAVPADALAQACFPLGGLAKAEVRRLANEAGLPVFNKRDSTGICFIGERPFREFLAGHLPQEPGPIETPEGKPIGAHQGLMFYTLGQRQGLGIGGQRGASGSPWYVAAKDLSRNTLVVVEGRDHRLLWSTGLVADRLHWIRSTPGELAADGALRCTVKTRYRQSDVSCTVRSTETDAVAVHFDAPQWAVTPGQYAVFYNGDECLGGGTIESTLPADTRKPELMATSA